MKNNTTNIPVVAAVALIGFLVAPVSNASTVRHSSATLTSSARTAENALAGQFGQRNQDSWEDETIRDAFQDILNRTPTRAELRRYRLLMNDEGWSEWEVREDIRTQARRNQNRNGRSLGSSGRSFGNDAENIVRRAYEDILNREPDNEGMRIYRSRILDDGWSETQVRQALRNSPEFRERGSMTRERAQEVVRRAYLSVLGREPDPASQGFVDRVLRDRWSQQDVERELRNSAEYRNRR